MGNADRQVAAKVGCEPENTLVACGGLRDLPDQQHLPGSRFDGDAAESAPEYVKPIRPGTPRHFPGDHLPQPVKVQRLSGGDHRETFLLQFRRFSSNEQPLILTI